MALRIKWGRSWGWNQMFQDMKITSIITNGCDCYPWTEMFFFLPKKSVSGQWIWWRKAYRRKIWAVWGNGFHMEPVVQYADMFEILSREDDILGEQ